MGHGSTNSSPWAVGSVALGEFLVEGHLGQGGFGQVDLVQATRSGERYAAKRIRAGDPASRDRFLIEARRWISLPAHPHINGCHFVRTAGDQLVVFSTYVPGGSLADWIDSGRLYQPDGDPVLRLIDIAVQAAWGLDAAHGMGLLHLDMKPANVLVTEDLTASVTDFGLASGDEREPGEIGAEEVVLGMLFEGVPEELAEVLKAPFRKRQVLGDAPDDSAGPQSRAEGMSRPYASPEQAEGHRIGGAADLWSWAVTVLEMFAGERSWISGTVADEVLARLVTEPDDVRIAIPPDVAELLDACFRADPAERPSSLGAVADQLAGRHAVRRSRPPRPSLIEESRGVHERTLVSGARWNDPRAWLNFACEAGVLDPEQMIRLWPSRLGSRRSQALEDLTALTEADRALAGLAAPSAQQRLASAMIHIDMGHIHQSLGDLPGAIQDYQQSVQLSAAVDDHQARVSAAEALNHLAIVLREQGRTDDAVAMCDRGLAICSSLGPDAEAGRLVGAINLTKANAWADLPGKLPLYDLAITAFEQAAVDEGTVKALTGKATTLQRLGRQAEADQAWARTDLQLDNLSHVVQVKRPGLLSAQAGAKYNRALLADTADDQLRFGQAAVDILRPLVEDLGWHELTGNLGQAVFLTGQAREQLGQMRAALDAYRMARRLLDEAVNRVGQLDLTSDLARSSDHEATLTGVLEDPQTAITAAEHAIELWRRLVAQDGLAAWGPQLASAQIKLGRTLSEAGELERALERFNGALQVLTEAQLGPAWPFLIAQAHLGRGYVLRRARQQDAAVSEYQQGLVAVNGMAGEENAVVRAELRQSLSNVYGDSGQLDEALRLLRMSIADLELLTGPAQPKPSATIRARLADAYQRCANKLAAQREYAQAGDAAARGLTLYHQLIGEGRSDLALEAARLEGTYGVLLGELGDLDGAVAALSASREALIRVAPGSTPLRDLMGPAAPAVTLDALVQEVADRLDQVKRRRGNAPG